MKRSDERKKKETKKKRAKGKGTKIKQKKLQLKNNSFTQVSRKKSTFCFLSSSS
jgi:hypothetical protein